MSDDLLIEGALDSWEDLRDEGKAIPLERFVEAHCGGWTPENVEEFLRRVAALGQIDRRLQAEGYKPTANGTTARWTEGQNSSPPTWSLTDGGEPIPGYRLRMKRGQGGFGEVWEAVGPGGFRVAMKFVRLERGAGETEVRALDVIKEIRHPNLLSVHGAWQKDGFLIIAMDLADRTLLDRFREAVDEGHAGIPADELIGYMEEAAKGIDFLNRAIHSGGEQRGGIQHRDIKPQNLLLVGGSVKVADFGLSRFLEQSVTGHSGNMTPYYAAPEFFDGRTSHRSDQYSLAVTYCLLRAGKLPFKGESVLQIIHAHIHSKPELSTLPQRERGVVARALAKQPEDRWPNCREFVHALAGTSRNEDRRTLTQAGIPLCPSSEAATKLSELKGATTVSPAPVDDGSSSNVSGAATASRRGRLRRGGLIGAALSLAVLGATIAIRWPRSGSDDPFKSAKAGLPKEISSSIGMKLVLIPAGEYLMGSPDSDKDAQEDEKPQHLVRITRPYYLGKTEVTVAQFRRFAEKTGYRTEAETDGKGGYGWSEMKGTFEQGPKYTWRNPGFHQTDEHPVVNVSWNDAIAFCDYASELDGLKPFDHLHARDAWEAEGYRLPTEAEWEYACRASTRTRYESGDNPESLVEVGNIADGTAALKCPSLTWAILAKDGYMCTAPVGQFRPNAFGLHDMHGNVWEWCWDGYDVDYYKRSPGADPLGFSKAAFRVNRGAGWYDNPRFARAASRDRDPPGFRDDDVGFRVLRVQLDR